MLFIRNSRGLLVTTPYITSFLLILEAKNQVRQFAPKVNSYLKIDFQAQQLSEVKVDYLIQCLVANQQ